MKFTRIHFAGSIIGAVVIGIIVFGMINYESDDSKSKIILQQNPEIKIHNTDDQLTETEKHAIDVVQNYKGRDGQGKSIVSVLGEIISDRFSDDVILNPNTFLGWGAFADPENDNLYGVTFDFKSQNDEFTFLWYVNLETNTIHDVGGGAKEILNIVNSDL